MPTDRPSRADEQLVRRLQDAGLTDMTWMRLKRWRKAGLVPDPEQQRIPGERGSTSVYPDDAFEQALVVARLLERHRDLDKVALLLFLADYPVELEALRRAVTKAVELIERQIARDAKGATDLDDVAGRTAAAIVAERPRTDEQRRYKRGMVEAAGDQRRLARVYAALARPMIGAPLSAGGLFGAYKLIGQDFRSLLGLEPGDFAAVEQRIDAASQELAAEGGVLALLQRHIGSFQLENFVNLREFCRDAATWVLSLGINLDTPHRYYTDCVTTLVNRELPTA